MLDIKFHFTCGEWNVYSNFVKVQVIKHRIVDIKEVLKCELSTTPQSICHLNSNKSKLLQQLEIDIVSPPDTEANLGDTCFITDSIALMQMANFSRAKSISRSYSKLNIFYRKHVVKADHFLAPYQTCYYI